MTSNNLHKIRVRVISPYNGMYYVDECCINACSYMTQNADRRFIRKEFRINKKSPKFNSHPEE